MAPNSLPPLPNLDGNININSVRETLRYSLQKVCQEFDDNAVLLIDENICEPMLKSYLGTPGSAFGELDLPIAHVQPLSGTGLTSTTAAKILQHLNIVIIVRNSPIRAQLVAQYILEIKRLWDKNNKDATSTAQPAFWVAVYPEVGLSFQRILHTAGIAAVTKVSEMPLHYFPFDKDLLCMHRPEVVKELLTDSNPAILSETARALVAFASAYGMPERIQAVGYHSCIVTDLVRGNLLDLEASALPAPLNEVTMARWIIFDRCADLLTPLMSQLTLEGRLDDLQATASRTGWLPPERDAETDSRIAGVKVLLHSTTPEWSTWRERHVQCLPELQAHTVQLEQKRRDASPGERWVQGNYLRYLQRPLHHLGKDMIDLLRPGGPLPEQHANEMEVLENRGRTGVGFFGTSGASPAETLLSLVLAGASLAICLRRLLLMVMMRGALSDAMFQECVTVLLDAFGPQHIHTLTSLEAAGLLTRKSTQKDVETDSSLTAMRLLFDKAERGGKDVLQLTHLLTSMAAAGVDPSDPYGRYQPVSALLIRQAMNSYVPHWMKGRAGLGSSGFATYPVREKEEPRRLLPEKETLETPLGQQTLAADKGGAMKPVLVVMLGGCTFAEMTSLKAAMMKKHNIKPIILTTDILTGDRFIGSFIPASAKLAISDAQATMATL